MRYWILVLAALSIRVAPAVGGGRSTAEVAYQLGRVIAGKHDGDAIELIGGLVAEYAEASEVDQALAIRAIGGAIGDTKEVGVRHAAIHALDKLRAPGSAKYLNRWLAPPRKGEIDESYFKAIEAAGMIADPPTLAKLVKLGDHKNTAVALAATHALGGYSTLPVAARKELAMELVRKLAQPTSVGTRGPGRAAGQGTQGDREKTGSPLGRQGSDEDAEARAAQLRQALQGALRTLTGASCSSAAEWVSWRKRAKSLRNPFE